MSVRGNYMDREQRRDALRQHFVEMHAEVDSLPPGADRRMARLLLAAFHMAGDAFYHWLVERKLVQPFGGTDKPPQEP